MAIVLACTGHLRGEAASFARLRPRLAEVYTNLIVVTPEDSDPAQVAVLRDLAGVEVARCAPGEGRFTALRQALATGAEQIHLTDIDRFIRWLATDERGWRRAVERLPHADCLVIGRSAAALATHPQALQETEQLINMVFSHLLGQPLDLGGGSRGFSRRAAALVLANSRPDAWGDAAWPVLTHRAGCRLAHLAVDGLGWETADHHQARVADATEQRRRADAYDQDPSRWARRVHTAHAIIEEGLAALAQPLVAGR